MENKGNNYDNMIKRFSLFILLAMMCTPRICAQKLTIERFARTNEITASQYPRMDYNNVACALVKVEVVDALTRAEGSVVGDIVDKGNEKWVYMENGARLFKLHFANHLPVTINATDYGISGLMSSNTYVLTLVGTGANTIAQMQSLTIHYQPQDAKMLLNGTAMDNAKDGVFSAILPVGTYKYMITKGEESIEGIVRLFKSSPQTLSVNLSQKESSVDTVRQKSEEEQSYDLAWSYIKDGKDAEAEALATKYVGEYKIFYDILEALLKCGYYDEDPQRKEEIEQEIMLNHRSDMLRSIKKACSEGIEDSAPTFGLG